MNSAEISKVVAPAVESCGLEVDAVEVMPAGKRTVVRVVVDGDGPTGHGPDMDAIAKASRAVSAALDESPVTGDGSYTLEVSSRGTARPLVRPEHWRRNTGRLVKVTAAGETFTGRIVDAAADEARVDVDGAVRAVAFGDVTKAHVQVELNRPADAGDDADDVHEEE